MKSFLTTLLLCVTFYMFSQIKTIHVYVALCDNEHQGIVPVNDKLGDGKNLRTNLYWGAGYGVKNFFKVKTDQWKYLRSYPTTDSIVLERLLFKHIEQDVYILADAYDGEWIKPCTEDFLLASNGQGKVCISYDSLQLSFSGESDLVTYIGHDGLMEFDVELDYHAPPLKNIDAIVLACDSEGFFYEDLKASGANPILWTTSFMAPEAYTLEAALNVWVEGASQKEIEEAAAKAYSTYQKCSYNWALTLFTSGFD